MLGASAPSETQVGRNRLQRCKVLDDTADDVEEQAEREYRARDADVPVVTQGLRDARVLLLVANRDNPKALGDFGYVVDDKAKAKPMT